MHCLASIGTQEALDVLADALPRISDVQTCDGVIQIRSAAVEALVANRYRKAEQALRAYIASRPRQTLSAGASGCAAQEEDTRRALEGLGQFAR